MPEALGRAAATARLKENWRRFLKPRSIAVVGASESGFASRNLYANLKNCGFGGEILPINPRASEVFGRRALSSLLEVQAPDAVVVLLSRDRVEETVAQAVKTGAGGVIVVAGGFRESGEREWTDAETRIAAATRDAGVPLIGPNCLGVMAQAAGAMMSIGPYPWRLQPGSVALLMQSGGQLTAACRYLGYLGTGVRLGVSLGNGTSVSFAELLDALVEDEETREIVLLIEEIPDWSAFRTSVARAHAAGKWIIACIIGRTPHAQRAASTHTGALAGNHGVLTSGLAQLGIRVGESLGATLSATVLQSRLGPPRKGGVAIAGVSGGGGGLAADSAASFGVELMRLSDATKVEICRINPAIRPENPLDIVGGPMDHALFGAVLRSYLRDPDAGVGLYLPSQGVPDDDSPAHLATMERVAEVAETGGTPVLVSSVVFAPIPEAQRERFLARKNLAILPTLEESFTALRTWRASPLDLIDRQERKSNPTNAAAIASQAEATQPFDESQLKSLLSSIGCEVPASRRLTLEDAGRLATTDVPELDELFWPVVLKGIGRRILHKARLGLVRLGIADRTSLQCGLRDLLAAPGIELVESVLIEEQLDPGTDLMLSVFEDRLGTVVAVGQGGERAGEASSIGWLGIDPSPEELHRGASRVLALLGAGDSTALIAFVGRLLQLRQNKGLSLIEINPARILSSGRIVALDAVAL